MRKFPTVITGFFFALLFTACKQYTVDIEDYLSYWVSESYVRAHTVNSVHHNDGENILCVPSATDVEVALTLYNPENIPLVTPSPTNAKNLIRFPGLSAQPVYGTDYTLTQTANSLLLKYTKKFLQEHEWGNGDIGPEITLKAQDGREFKQKYAFKIRANTPPQKPDFMVAKTVGTPSYYVLCIAIRGMEQKVSGRLVHKDLTRIEVNDTAYEFSVNEGQPAFIKPEAGVFITRSDVEKLSDPNADDIPSGGWVLYYKTDAEVKEGAAKKDYTLRLADAKGLVSEALNASTKPNRPQRETVTITKGTESGSATGSASDPKLIGADSTGAKLTVSSATGNTLVHCTLTDMGSGAVTEYTGNPVSVPLALNGEEAKTYKLDYYTDGEGFTATPVKTVYYKVLQKYTVTFNAQQGSDVPQQVVLHGDKASKPASPARTGYTFGEWYKNAACPDGQEWNFTTDTVTRNITLYAKWIPGTGTSYRVEHYQETTSDPAGQYPLSPSETTSPTPTGVTGHTFTTTDIDNMKKTYTGFEFDKQELTHPSIKADGSTVIKLFYKRKTVNVTFKPDGGTISGGTPNLTVLGRFGTAFTAPPNPVKTGYTFSGWSPNAGSPPLSMPPKFPANDATYTAQWMANTYTVRFNGGTGSSGSMSDQQFTYDEPPKQLSQNTFTKTNYRFTGWATSSGSSPVVHTDKKSVRNLTSTKNGVVNLYAVWAENPKITFKVEGGKGGSLRCIYYNGISTTSANNNISSSSGETVHVKYNSNVNFTASPTTGWNIADWSVSSGTLSDNATSLSRALNNVISDVTVTVKFYRSEISNSLTNPWGELKQAVKDAPEGGTIKINGTIQATSAWGNNGELEITKNLTIEAKSGTATLDADNRSRIFNIESGTLTMKRLNLQNGKSSDNGAGIFVNSGASLELKNSCVIKDCVSSANGGGIYMAGTCSVLLEDSVINNCIAKKGGGVYVPNGNTFKMKGRTAISIDCNDDSDKDKNAVYLENTAKINLTGHVGDHNMIARIIPQSYTARQVLTGDIISSAPENYLRVMVKPDNHTYWVVDNAGNLNSTPDKIFEYISTPAIKAYEPLMKPDVISNRAQLLNKILVYKTSSNNYGIMYITQVDNTIPGFIKFNYKTRDNDNRVIKEESDRRVNGTYIFDLDTGTEPASGDPTHIADFWLQNGGSTSFNPENSAQFYLIP